jgi:rod shape-determining protein MreC
LQLEAGRYEDFAIKPLFTKGPILGLRLLVLAVLSLGLMLVDARLETLKPLRSHLSLVLTPFYWVADLPVRVWSDMTRSISSHGELLAENEKLKAEALLMQRRLQKLATLTEQNVRLRELLDSAELVDEKVVVTELIGMDPNPFTQRVMIDKGEADGVFLGQPVLDAGGLIGHTLHAFCCSPILPMRCRCRSLVPACVPSPAAATTPACWNCVMFPTPRI